MPHLHLQTLMLARREVESLLRLRVDLSPNGLRPSNAYADGLRPASISEDF